jgi:pyruvate kinase
MLRRTKIIATLGPATDSQKMLDAIIQAGVDVVRLNFSHGNYDEHRWRAENVRDRARAHGRQVGLIADLQGPKIRIDCFQNGKIFLKEGDKFILDADLPVDAGDQFRVGLTYKALPRDVRRGDTLLLNDGRMEMWVEAVNGNQVECKVVIGGELSDHKGINRKGGGLTAPALTQKDKEDIKFAAEIDADYLAVSFPRCPEDLHQARDLLKQAGGKGRIIAKMERAEAIRDLDNMIMAADAVMIARGDLGVEIGDEALPYAQKTIIKRARELDRVTITATQMMQSMVSSQVPTRAEVFDVANAVLDGTDAVMLSEETATGEFPDKAVEAMGRVCVGVEKNRVSQLSDHRDTTFQRTDEAIAMATMYTANHLGVKAIAALTESGSTPLWMSRISSGIPVYALSRQVSTRRQVTLYRGVYPVSFDVAGVDVRRLNKEIIAELQRRGAVRKGDLVIITKGDLQGIGGGTNLMKIVRVGEDQASSEN